MNKKHIFLFCIWLFFQCYSGYAFCCSREKVKLNISSEDWLTYSYQQAHFVFSAKAIKVEEIPVSDKNPFATQIVTWKVLNVWKGNIKIGDTIYTETTVTGANCNEFFTEPYSYQIFFKETLDTFSISMGSLITHDYFHTLSEKLSTTNWKSKPLFVMPSEPVKTHPSIINRNEISRTILTDNPNAEGWIHFQLLIGDKGEIEGIEAIGIEASEHELLIQKGQILLKKLKFSPATIDGKPTTGYYRIRISWEKTKKALKRKK